MKKIPIVCLCILALSIGCHKQVVLLAQGWSMPTKFAETEDSLGGGVVLYNWHSRILALQPQSDGAAKCYLLNSNDKSWAEVPFTGVPRGYLWYRPAIDQDSDRVLFDQSYKEDDKLVIAVLVGRVTVNGSLAVRDVAERKWTTDTKALFGETRPDVRLSEPGRRIWPAFGMGVINGNDLYFPYSIGGVEVTHNGKTLVVDGSKGPYANGVFHSTNSGTTWQMEKTPDSLGGLSSVVKTENHFYCFAIKLVRNQKAQLWFTQRPAIDGSWVTPETITKSYGSDYVAVPQGDTIHLFWLDALHEKRRGNPVYPHAGNYEVVYSQRKDSDASWSKDVILSEGLLYSYAPSVSVEGDKIVVAWAGVQTAGVWHSQFDPNDIFYVTSRDKGNTWTKPLRVTDNIKEGITAGDPQVVLLNGVIHLFYIQGKMDLQQLSPGLTKLNQPPWPIYYTQRPFPD
jgi:hypothetical protein